MQTIRVSAGAVALSLAAAFAVALPARAQAPKDTVRIHVTDSTGAPVVGADVSIVHKLTTLVAHGTTDERGREVLFVPRDEADNNLVVRKIGYTRADRFFNDAASLTFEIRLNPAVHALEAVKVTAEEDVRRKSYFIDAEAIETSPRPIADGLDVVLKLRPDMILGRKGAPDNIGHHVSTNGRPIAHRTAASTRSSAGTAASAQAAADYGYCPAVASVWVNGSRIRYVPTDVTAEARLVGAAALMPSGVASALASIKPEHIAEMQYHPCDQFIAGTPPGSMNAVFVTLKPGIRFEPGLGSFLETAVMPGLRAATAESAAPATPVVPVIGVFDEATGDVVPDAEVVDVVSGTYMKTSRTGTAALAFLSAGAKEIRIQKPGYDPQTIPLSNAKSMTVVLTPHKAPEHPPQVRQVGTVGL